MRRIVALGFAAIVLLSPALAQEGQTLKERLSDKASDAQRVDNCRVPPERRGTVPRPDCADKSEPASPQAQKAR
jgi:hypothetical protein